MKKKSIFLNLMVLALMLGLACSSAAVKAAEKPAADDKVESWKDINNVDEKRKVGELPNTNMKLYYVEKDEFYGDYRGFILQFNEQKRFFKWENVTNPAYGPQLTLADVDKDGREEIIVTLCKGYGTGVYEGEVHVVRQKWLEEILVENPSIILHKENIILRELPEHFEVVLNNTKTIINKRGRLTPPYAQSGIGWGDYEVKYAVKHNKLYARVPLGIGVTSAGEFIIEYKYKQGILQKGNVRFELQGFSETDE